MLKVRGELGDTALAPVVVVFAVLTYSITSPTVYSNMGHLFFYPLYSTYGLQCLYTTGTWCWMYFIIWMMAKIGNDKFNDTIYNYVCGASLYAYVSHYFFILILSVMIVRPYKITFIPALFIMLSGTFLLIFLTYWPLNFLYESISPPRETKKMEVDGKTPEIEAQEQDAAMVDAVAAAKADALEKGSEGARDLENYSKASGLSGEMQSEDI